MPNKNDKLNSARKNKKDEFYTQLKDIEAEVSHYTKHLEGKTVYCNCDDPTKSNFVKYFKEHFNELKLKRLIATCWKGGDGLGTAWKLDSDNGESLTTLTGDGDFRSEECIKLLKEADIVVTNPPFSLFRTLFKTLLAHNKKFLLIGEMNAITHNEVFPSILAGDVWLGWNSGDMSFTVPEDYEERATRFWIDETGQKWRSMGNIYWFTNIDSGKQIPFYPLTETYSPEKYPNFTDCDGIEVSRAKFIPCDYDGVMGVPVSFLDKLNPDQFEIVGKKMTPHIPNRAKGIYKRLLIRRKHR